MGFKVGDKVRALTTIGSRQKGSEDEIISADGSYYEIKDGGRFRYSDVHEKLELIPSTPVYRWGDVYEWPDRNCQMAVGKNGRGMSSLGCNSDFDTMENLVSCGGVHDLAGGKLNLGKFLYNVFDKEEESAATSPAEQAPIWAALAYDPDIIAIDDTRCMDVKYKRLQQEAIMPLTIIKTTTQELPGGEVKSTHKANGHTIEDLSDEEIILLIEESNEEIKAKAEQVKLSEGCKRMTKQLSDMKKVRKVLINLLDARSE